MFKTKPKSLFGTVNTNNRVFGTGSNKRSHSYYKVNENVNPLLANVYTFLQASYGDIEAELKMTELGYVFDKELSTIRTRVWVKNGKPLILHRGSTDLLRDFAISDTLLLFNKSQFDPRYFEARNITKSTQIKYNEVADHCGHSLGGNCAELVADVMSNVVTYNKGTSPYSILKKINPRQTDIRTKSDLVSLMSKFQDRNVITVESTAGSGLFSPHTLDNLKGLDLSLV